MPNIQVVQPGQNKKRMTRTPNFPIVGACKPFGLYPTFFHPVLPGETLSQAVTKQTLVSSPVKSPLCGCWLETWMFYVKLTDIDRNLSAMFISNDLASTTYEAVADRPRYFTKAGQIDWCYLASEVIHNHFFLDEDESPLTIDGVHKIKRIVKDFTESGIKTSADDGLPEPSAQEDVQDQLTAYMAMRQMGMASLSYEDYLKTYGVQTVQVEEGEPEMLSYRRYWTLPSNTIDPTDGSPSGAWYWRIDEKSEKNYRFKEPGFIVAMQAVRPKVFDSTQVASFNGELWGFSDWFPSYTLHDPSAGIKKFAVDGNPVFDQVGEGTNTYDLWFDHRDFLSYGEQFINGASRLDYPSTFYRSFADGASPQQVRGQYVSDVHIADLFVSVTASDQFVDYEGLASLNIKGHIQDNT